MRIKRTFAVTMRDALALVKQEQGADAVILGNKKVPGGVEILSAIDFDEAEVAGMATTSMPQRELQIQPAPTAASTASVANEAWMGTMFNDGRREPTLGPVAAASPKAAPVTANLSDVRPEPIRLPKKMVVETPPLRAEPQRLAASPSARAKPQRVAAASPAAPRVAKNASAKSVRHVKRPASRSQDAANPAIDEVKIELKNLRDLMASQLSVMQWDRFTQKHPVRTVLLSLMSEMGLGTDVCETVLSHLDQLNDDPQKVWQRTLGILAHCIPINRRDLFAEGGRIALVGSTGVGKTTTIAKIAARFAHLHGKHSVAMITTDQFRIGAQEQLQHYARLLEVPLLVAGNSEELCDRLSMLTDKKLVLIDTAGMNQRDLRLSEQFHHLQVGAPEIKPYLVLSANTQLAALNQTILNFGKVKLAGALVTKLDEAACLGGIITASIRHQLVLAYCGTGQQVPADLEVAKSHRLISKAVALMQRYAEQSDQDAMALRYNRIINKN